MHFPATALFSYSSQVLGVMQGCLGQFDAVSFLHDETKLSGMMEGRK
jgi:hypothetical protein